MISAGSLVAFSALRRRIWHASFTKTYLVSGVRLVAENPVDYKPSSDLVDEEEETAMEPQVASSSRPAVRAVAQEPRLSPGGGAPLRVVMNGDRLDIQASVDLEGLKKLQTMLQKYQSILEMMQPDK
jgi:hypothetical protein